MDNEHVTPQTCHPAIPFSSTVKPALKAKSSSLSQPPVTSNSLEIREDMRKNTSEGPKPVYLALLPKSQMRKHTLQTHTHT